MIRSRQNSRLKDIRRLRRSKGSGDRALLEGHHLIGEALEAGLELETVLATPGFLATPAGERLAERLPSPALEVEPRILDEVADSDSPRGVVATARLPRGGAGVLPVVENAVYLYLEKVQDPGNLGALARVAEAGGAAGLALGSGSARPNHPRALRGSAGSLLRLPVACSASPADTERHLAPAKPKWVALAPEGGRDLYETPLEGSLLIAAGAEGPGLSDDVLGRAHLTVTIPMARPVESLNVTVAAALALFEVLRRRRANLSV